MDMSPEEVEAALDRLGKHAQSESIAHIGYQLVLFNIWKPPNTAPLRKNTLRDAAWRAAEPLTRGTTPYRAGPQSRTVVGKRRAEQGYDYVQY